jgi:RIO kinase 2
VDNPAEAFLRLSREDLSVLSSIETGMRAHEWVPIQEIARQSGLPLRKVEYRLRILSEQKLVTRTTIHYEGYQIDFDAYDLLAISDLLKRNFITSIGDKIGVGKESVVFEALGEIPLVIKFHRQGRTSFKHVRRARDHLTDLPRLPWLYAASLAARHEFQVMQRLYPKVSVPRPVALSRHALAMELIYGDQLNRVVLSNPQDCLEMILDEVGNAYHQGIVHADLSEFNVMVTIEGLKIIDWPQAVETNHPNASVLLERDVGNVLRFFARRYKMDLSLEEAISMVKGESVKDESVRVESSNDESANEERDNGTSREAALR